MTLVLVNWRKFQHYHHRQAPRVKVYADLIHDRQYRALPPTARALLIDLWLLASKTLDGCLQVSTIADLAWELRETRDLTSDLRAIADQTDNDGSPKWLDPLASTLLATCEQLATPEYRDRDRVQSSVSPNGLTGADAPHVASTPQGTNVPPTGTDDDTEGDTLAALRPLLYPAGGQTAPGNPKGDVNGRDVSVLRMLIKRGIPAREVIEAVAEFRRQVDTGNHHTFVAPGDHFTMRAIAKPGYEYDTVRELLHAVHKRDAAQGRGRGGPLTDIKTILAKGAA